MKKWVVGVLAWLMSISAIAATDDTLVVYSGRGEALVGPLLEQFTEQTGIKLDVRYNSTASLATQVLHEQEKTPADVVFFQESGYLGFLSQAGLLAPLDNKLTAIVPASYKDKGNQWVGTSARLRVLVYNPQKVTSDQLPATLEALTDKKWQRHLGWAPTNASLQAHLSALRAVWGDARTKQWLTEFYANQPMNYPRNSQIVQAVGRGEIDMGWTNHYYLYQLKRQDPTLQAENYHFPEQGRAGNLLIVSGVGIIRHSQKQEAAAKLVEFLLSEPSQRYITQSGYEYPVRHGVKAADVLTPLADIELLEVDQTSIADVSPTVTMLQEMGIL
jgi:iron(III) transport system substrate-binding protein